MSLDINDYTTRAGSQIVLDVNNAKAYASAVAEAALSQYIQNQGASIGGAKKLLKKGQTDMNKPGISSILSDVKGGAAEAAQNILRETETSAALVSGEILLDNIETIADRLILSRLSWWQKLTITKKNKELAVVIATYAIVHAIKTGGFGLTKYRLDHAVLRFITLAANQKLLKAIVQATGVDTNIAGMFLTAPTILKASDGE